ncbi:Uncharacterised protein [Proteus vulgaris]|uniref:hypothetical protein n=1 Tax=Proteus vulgaris TaxID=585 RepID=UPI000DFD9027|nr:hypothetical protein [Proteus vulgaris]SUC14155.1 Uncharacterised protein [Proteus vulgaris]
MNQIKVLGHGAPFFAHLKKLTIVESESKSRFISMSVSTGLMDDYVKEINKHISAVSNTSTMLTLQSCYSAMGGRCSSAQYMANSLNIKVAGFKGKTNETGNMTLTSDCKKKVFTPQTSPLAKAITTIGYHIGYRCIKTLMTFKNLAN